MKQFDKKAKDDKKAMENIKERLESTVNRTKGLSRKTGQNLASKTDKWQKMSIKKGIVIVNYEEPSRSGYLRQWGSQAVSWGLATVRHCIHTSRDSEVERPPRAIPERLSETMGLTSCFLGVGNCPTLHSHIAGLGS